MSKVIHRGVCRSTKHFQSYATLNDNLPVRHHLNGVFGGRCTAIILALWLGSAFHASADTVDDFYRQKTINFIMVFSPGGTYDLYTRLVAAHLPQFIPGNPKIIVQYMPGAGGFTGASYLASRAPQDGTVLGMVAREIAVNQVLHSSSVPLDARRFQWIGSVSSYVGVLHVAGRTGIKTADDLRSVPVVMGSWGFETSSYTIPVLLNALAGTKFKVVAGYRGAPEVDLAVEKGEIDGRISSWSNLKFMNAAQIDEGKIVVVMQSGVKRHPDLPKVPRVSELATGEQGRRILEFIDSDSGIGWSVTAPPGVPADRVAVLRHAFDQMVADPAFIADVQARRLDLVPSTGQELDALIKRTLSTPETDIAYMKNLLNTK
jgi:tripartite-type tricarboxylate transporter receptor subunit TctC